MPEITIDADICKKEGLWAMACTHAVSRQEGNWCFYVPGTLVIQVTK
jgi:hypothetical protein